MEFSVVIPTYNRLSHLRLTLQSIFGQEYNDYEVIVVDDGSTDGTDSYLRSLVAPKLKWIFQNNRGPAAARNTGIKLAQGKFIAFTDDDCAVPKNWLKNFHEVFSSTEADIVGGAVRNICKDNIFSETSQHITNYFVEYLQQKGKQSPFLTSNNIAYRVDVLKKVGGFNECFKRAGGEERALNLKIINNGGKSIFSPDIIVDHNHDMNFRKYTRQQMNYGRGAYVLYRVVGKDFERRPDIIPFFVYIKLACSFFTENFIKGFSKCVLFITGQAFSVFGYCLQAAKKKQKEIYE
jgi:glycosyltransferase involved in cell wall biosynthesis